MKTFLLILVLIWILVILCDHVDVHSPEFREVAKKAYDRVVPFIEKSWVYRSKHRNIVKHDWKFPLDAQEHYDQLLNITASLRQFPVHCYSDYCGPWIENQFYLRFMSRPLASFGGFIPLFVQWVDSLVLKRNVYASVISTLRSVLRPNVIYLAISQSDAGLSSALIDFPNIFTLSSGGWGHVPLPLIHTYLNYSPIVEPLTFQYNMSFWGHYLHRVRRDQIIEILQAEGPKVGLELSYGFGAGWREAIAETKFNIAPAGVGRSSFRFTEIVQMGRIPVYIFEDLPWTPYHGTNYSIETIGFISGLDDHSIPRMLATLAQVSESLIREKLERVKEARRFFTYDGVFDQIERFMHDPCGTGPDAFSQLRCVELYEKERPS